MSKNKFALGIDLGTTSVKTTVIDSISLQIVEEHSNSTDSYIVHDNIKSEQDVNQIVNSLNHCMSLISEKILEKVIGIGICGQMHGLVCWSSNNRPWQLTKSYGTNMYVIDRNKITPHYNWQDNRCDPKFLSSLPKPDSHLSIHSGYGCCTLFWLMKNSSDTIEKFNCAGTIADFIVAMLCDLDVPKMCSQNAASWGYFNTSNNTWNINILKSENFPVHILPNVLESNSTAGNLKSIWHHIPAGTPVGVALGDLQSSVSVNMKNENYAVCNISTSAQIAFIAKNFHPSHCDKNSRVKIVPYFDQKYLSEAAALNGGNAIFAFVSNVLECLENFGCPLEKDVLWERLIESGNLNSAQSDLIFNPTFLGERYAPECKASICNITSDNLKLVPLFRALCKGVISNLQSIVSAEQLQKQGITKIIGTGTALMRNKILQRELETQYLLPVEYRNSRDAPYGAAVSVLKTLN